MGDPVTPRNTKHGYRNEGEVHPEIGDAKRGGTCSNRAPSEGDRGIERDREGDRAERGDPWRLSKESEDNKERQTCVCEIHDRHPAHERDGLRGPAFWRAGEGEGWTSRFGNELVSSVEE